MCGRKYLLKTPGNAISKTLNFKMSLDASAPNNLPATCHCTVQVFVFVWRKWPVHDLVLVIPPPPLIKVASNTRPYSKLGGTTSNGREEGGQYYISQTYEHSRSDLKQERSFLRGSVSIFLRLVVAYPTHQRSIKVVKSSDQE